MATLRTLRSRVFIFFVFVTSLFRSAFSSGEEYPIKPHLSKSGSIDSDPSQAGPQGWSIFGSATRRLPSTHHLAVEADERFPYVRLIRYSTRRIGVPVEIAATSIAATVGRVGPLDLTSRSLGMEHGEAFTAELSISGAMVKRFGKDISPMMYFCTSSSCSQCASCASCASCAACNCATCSSCFGS